jgi:hypothetical protein
MNEWTDGDRAILGRIDENVQKLAGKKRDSTLAVVGRALGTTASIGGFISFVYNVVAHFFGG